VNEGDAEEKTAQGKEAHFVIAVASIYCQCLISYRICTLATGPLW